MNTIKAWVGFICIILTVMLAVQGEAWSLVTAIIAVAALGTMSDDEPGELYITRRCRKFND